MLRDLIIYTLSMFLLKELVVLANKDMRWETDLNWRDTAATNQKEDVPHVP